MANTIEILVTAKNLTKATFDTVGEQARTIGQKTGQEFSRGLESEVKEAVPAAVGESLRKVEPVAATEGDRAGLNFTEAFGGRVREQARTIGQKSGEEFSWGFEDEVKDKIPPVLDEPLDQLPPKGREKGKETGAQFSAGLSPLLTAAFVGAATVGPAAILAGVSSAVVAAGALLGRSNKQVAQDATILGQQVEATLTNAVGPIAGDIDAGITTLEQGVTRITPELDQLFAAAGPDATELASGLAQLAEGALPGIVSGVRSFAPEMHAIAGDLGKIGQGVGGFIGGLGVGASGSASAFGALAKSLSEVLPELGQTIGYLANGLGPVVSDVLPGVNLLAKAIELVASSASPGEIQALGVAIAGLYASFKVAGMAGALQEGATFTSFLKGTPVVAKEAEGALASFASKGVKGLSAAMDLALGPLGMIIAGAGLLGNELGKLSGVGDHTAGNVDALTSSMFDAANGSASAQKNLDGFAKTVQFMADSPGHATDGLKSLDDAFTQLYQTNPTAAAKEFDILSKSLESQGKNASDVAKEFPSYTKAVADAQLQSHLMGAQTDQLTAGLITQATTAKTSAEASAQTTLAALGATDGTSKLVNQLYNSLTAYSAATTGANGYSTALQAMNGITQTLDDAQNALAQQMLNAKTSFAQNKYSMDLSTQAGIDNRQALSAASKAIIQMGVDQYQANGNMTQANQLIQDQVNAYVKATGATGKAKDAIVAYLEQITKIPPNVATTVDADITPAQKKLGQFINQVNTSSGTVTIYGSADSAGSSNFGRGFGAKATGGNVGGIGAAATGGVRGSWTRVNEQGPELMELPFGTHVFSAPDSQRMMAQAAQNASSGGGGAFELSVSEGSDGAVATMIMRLVREGKLQIKQKAIVR